ncbi:MAG: hypothetical protein N2038_02820 [Geminicoccaceae bacterium]|nr:hypothetical protein [Geminicoccaceae bacterium]MCX7629161.1 hypothetical protein [Geminicoccaceae bacterium]
MAASAVLAQPPTSEGARLAQRRCAACHGESLTERFADARRKRSDEELDRFLERHFAPDPRERRAIVDWSLTRAAGAESPPR